MKKAKLFSIVYFIIGLMLNMVALGHHQEGLKNWVEIFIMGPLFLLGMGLLASLHYITEGISYLFEVLG